MKLRTFTVVGVTGLSLLTAAASYSANKIEKSVEQLAIAEAGQTDDCMLDGFDTPEGRVGCFEPVIAIIDESFFTTDDETTEEASD
ncbi:MAG: hypothetical protein AAGP08_09330 [Pseudomonadota bacterium]